jgi:hypothetical protein
MILKAQLATSSIALGRDLVRVEALHPKKDKKNTEVIAPIRLSFWHTTLIPIPKEIT